MAFTGRTIAERMRAPFAKGAGLNLRGLLGMDNGPTGVLRVMNALGSAVADVAGKDSNNKDLILGSYNRPLRKSRVFNLAANGSLATQRFFVADEPVEITAISCSYATADGATNTAIITKEVAGQAPGTGVSVMTNSFNLNTTTNTAQWATFNSRDNPGYFGPGEPRIALNTNEMLSINIASGVTSLAGLIVTVYYLPQTSLEPAVFVMNANGSLATQYMYLSNRYVTVSGVTMVWSAAGTDPGAVTIDVTHETSTSAPGAGSSILAAAQSAKGTANVPIAVSLNSTATRLLLAPGDRLSVKFTGTLTALAGVVVVVSFTNLAVTAGVSQPQQLTNAIFNLTTAGTNQAVFGPSEIDLEIYDGSFVWTTAGSGNLTFTIDPAGTAPGAGTSVFTDNTNAGPATTGAANTPVVGTRSVSRRTLLLPAGACVGIKYGGTLGSLAGVVGSLTLAQPGS